MMRYQISAAWLAVHEDRVGLALVTFVLDWPYSIHTRLRPVKSVRHPDRPGPTGPRQNQLAIAVTGVLQLMSLQRQRHQAHHHAFIGLALGWRARVSAWSARSSSWSMSAICRFA